MFTHNHTINDMFAFAVTAVIVLFSVCVSPVASGFAHAATLSDGYVLAHIAFAAVVVGSVYALNTWVDHFENDKF